MAVTIADKPWSLWSLFRGDTNSVRVSTHVLVVGPPYRNGYSPLVVTLLWTRCIDDAVHRLEVRHNWSLLIAARFHDAAGRSLLIQADVSSVCGNKPNSRVRSA